jgi:uncharacterized radical SAM superfamily Fe-S cluster-containing enzyme
MLDNAITIKPKRQMSVQFSGGEPTLRPTSSTPSLRRKVGYNSVQAATNGIEFAKSKEFCRRPPKPVCATSTCSSTASATPPTRTARWATCST